MAKARLTAFQLTRYSALAVPLSFLWIPLILWIPAYYIEDLGVGLAVAGNIFLLARIWDAVSDPLIGSYSDLTSSRFGRRKPWILLGVPALVVASYFLQVPPANATGTYLLFSLFFFYLCWTVVQIPHMAWGADLSHDYQERSRIIGFRGAGSMIGIFVGSLIPVIMFGNKANSVEVLELYAKIIAIMLPVFGLIAVMTVPEQPAVKARKKATARETVQALRENKPFTLFIIAFFFWDVALAVFEIPMKFIVERSLLLDGYFPQLLATDYCVAIIMTPVIIKLTSVVGKHRAFSLSGVLFAIGCGVLIFATPGNIWHASIGYGLIGMATAGFWCIPISMVADASDLGFIKTGTEQTGLYVAIFNFAWKMAIATGGFTALHMLALLNFDVDPANLDSNLGALKVVGLGMPILLVIPAIIILWRYPLTENKHNEIRDQLKEMA